MELGKDKSLDDIVDLPLDDLVKSLPRRAARGGVRAEKQPARDGVSADGGKRRGREGGEGRIREGGKGNGPDSPAVSAEQALGTDALGRAPGTRPKAVGRPKRTRKCWRPVEVQPRVSADYCDPHLARGKSGKNKTPKGGGRELSGDGRSLKNIVAKVGPSRGSRPTIAPDRQQQPDLTFPPVIGIMRGTAVAETAATTVASEAVAGSEIAGETTA